MEAFNRREVETNSNLPINFVAGPKTDGASKYGNGKAPPSRVKLLNIVAMVVCRIRNKSTFST